MSDDFFVARKLRASDCAWGATCACNGLIFSLVPSSSPRARRSPSSRRRRTPADLRRRCAARRPAAENGESKGFSLARSCGTSMSLMWKRFVTTTDGAQRLRRARGVGGAREERGVSGGLQRRGKELDVKPTLIVGGEAASERLALVQAQLEGTAAARVCGSCGEKTRPARHGLPPAPPPPQQRASSCAPDATAAKFEPADAHPSATKGAGQRVEHQRRRVRRGGGGGRRRRLLRRDDERPESPHGLGPQEGAANSLARALGAALAHHGDQRSRSLDSLLSPTLSFRARFRPLRCDRKRLTT